MRVLIFLSTLLLSVSIVVSNEDVLSNEMYNGKDIKGSTPRPTECPRDDYDGALVTIPHETDCDKFYVCIDGEKVLQDCPEGLHFDPEQGTCDWPSVVNCQLTSITPPTTESSPPWTTTSRPTTTTRRPWTTSKRPTTTHKPSPPWTTSKRPSTTTTQEPWPPWTTTKKPNVTSTAPPTTTTSEPSTTTSSQPPTTTSSQTPTTSTQPPTTTSSQPPTTTSSQPPITTSSKPPTTTSSEPSTTSSQPPTTSSQPPTTSSQQPTTTSSQPPPTTTSQPPTTTSSQPSITTTSQTPTTSSQPPTTSSQPPTTTSAQPPTTTSAQPPTTTSSEPPTTTSTELPTTSSQLPTTTTSEPPITTSSQPPSTTTSQPPTTSAQPPTTASSQPPTATSSQPPTTSSQPPTTSSQQPTTTSSQPPPTTTSQPPTTTSSQPSITTTSQTPTTSSQPPTTSSQPPTTTSAQPPTTTSSEPPTTTSTELPTTSSQLPTTTTSEPPITTSSQPPSTTTSQPPTTSAQPPTTTSSQPPTTTSSQPPTTSSQPPTTSSQPPTTSSQTPTITSSQPPTTTSQTPTTSSQSPTTTSAQPPTITSAQPPTTSAQPPTTTSAQPPTTTSSAPPTTSSQPPTTTSSQPPITTSSQPTTIPPSELPTTTSSKPPTTTSSEPPTTTSSQPPTTTSSKPPTTSSQPPATTSSQPPITTSSQPPTTTSSQPPTTTSSQPPTTTSSQPPTTTSSQPPTTTSSQPPTTTSSQPPTSGTSTTESTAPPTTTSVRPSTSTTPKPTTTTEKPGYPTSCPKKDPIKPIYLPHECVCSKYYLCSKGKQILEECPKGLHFNPTIHDCDLPEDAGCATITTTPKPEPTTPIPTDCPIWGSSEEAINIAHETNCSLFYTCANGGKVLRECPPGLYFNPAIQVCDWPWNVNCTNKPAITTTTLKPTTITTQKTYMKIHKREAVYDENMIDIFGDSTIETTTPAWENPDTCIGKCPPRDPQNYTVQLPNIRCSKFCKCSNGRPFVVPCPDGLQYSVILEVCTFPYEANCTGIGGIISTTTNLPTTTISTKLPPNSTISTPNPVIKIVKREAVYDVGIETTASTEPTIQTTTPEWQNPDTCIGKCPPRDPQNYTVQLPNIRCSKFCKCSNGRPFVIPCPDGLQYSVILEVCTYPYEANCTGIGGIISTTTNLPTTTISTKLPPNSTVSTPNPVVKIVKREAVYDQGNATIATTEPTIQTTTPEWQNPDTCIGKCPPRDPQNYTVQLPNIRCSKFCKCSNGRPFVIPCPDGLQYSIILEVCTYPYEANCTGIGGIISTTTNAPTTTISTKLPQNSTVSTPNPVVKIVKREAVYDQENATTATTEPTIQSTTPEWQNPDTCIGKCPPVDPKNYTVLLPNIHCSKFCICSNGRAIVSSCPPNLHFSVELEVCTYPYEANCTGIGGVISTTTSTELPSSKSTITSTVTTSTETIVPSTGTPVQTGGTSTGAPGEGAYSELPVTTRAPPSFFKRLFSFW